SGLPRPRDQPERRDLLVAAAGDERNRRAFGMADEGDTLRVNVAARPEPLHDAQGVVGVVGQRRAFDPPAASADAALVVPDDEESGIRDRGRELAEDRNPENFLVARLRSGSADQHDSRKLA